MFSGTVMIVVGALAEISSAGTSTALTGGGVAVYSVMETCCSRLIKADR